MRACFDAIIAGSIVSHDDYYNEVGRLIVDTESDDKDHRHRGGWFILSLRSGQPLVISVLPVIPIHQSNGLFAGCVTHGRTAEGSTATTLL